MSSALEPIANLITCSMRARRNTAVSPRSSITCPIALRWRIRWALDPSNGVAGSWMQLGPRALGCQHFPRFSLSRYSASSRFHGDEVVRSRRRQGTRLHGLATPDLGGEAFTTCGRWCKSRVGLVSIVLLLVHVRGGRSRMMGRAVRPHCLHGRGGVIVGPRPWLCGTRATKLHCGRLRGRRARQ